MNRLLWTSSWRYFIRQPLQLLLAILGIALGVAVVSSIDIARNSAEKAFDYSTQAIAGEATHQIIGGPDGLDEQIYVRLRTQLNIFPSAPIVRGYAVSHHSGKDRLEILGIDPFAEAQFRKLLTIPEEQTSQSMALQLVTSSNGVLLNAKTAQRLNVSKGSTVKLTIGPKKHTVVVLGVLSSAPKGLDNILITDISTAQELLAMPGKLSNIDLKLADNLNVVAQQLPSTTQIVAVNSQANTTKKMADAFHINLIALSLLALVVGAFLVFNTMSFIVVQRRELIGNLRVLGVTRGQIQALILTESGVLGFIGTCLGLALGILLAQVLVDIVTRTINDLYFPVSVSELSIAPFTVVKSIILGLGATLIVSLGPAYEASQVKPRLAMIRSQLEQTAQQLGTRFALVGLLFCCLSLVIFYFSAQDIVLGFAAQFALILGCALLTPKICILLLQYINDHFSRFFEITTRMAMRNIRASLSRTGVAISALMVAIATTIGIGLLIGSFRMTVMTWLESLLRADMYIASPAPTTKQVPEFSSAFVQQIASTPGVSAISTVRRFNIRMYDQSIPVAAYQMAPRSYQGFRFAAGIPHEIWPAFDHQAAIIVSEPLAYRLNLKLNQMLRLPTLHGLRDFKIVGIYYDYSSDQGIIAMSQRNYATYWDGHGVNSIGVYAEPGSDEHQLRNQLLQQIPPDQRISINLTRSIREDSMLMFDRTFAITRVLRFLAAIIAFVGIVSALTALQLERTRELGLLRACGMTPPQLNRLILTETSIMGLLAGIIAIPVGIMIAITLVKVIYRRSFGWLIELHLEPSIILQGLLLALLAAVLAGIYPAYRMSQTSPAAALRNE